MQVFIVGKGPVIKVLAEHIATLGHSVCILEDCSLGRTKQTLQSYCAARGLPYHPFDRGSQVNGFLAEHASADAHLISFDNFLVFSPTVCRHFDARSVNFHPAPLPYYGGINPISWGLLNGEAVWGYTLHAIAAEVDQGAILFQQLFPVEEHMTQTSIMTACTMGAVRELKRILGEIDNHGFCPVEQPDEGLTRIRCRKRFYSFDDRPSREQLALAAGDMERIAPRTPYTKWQWERSAD